MADSNLNFKILNIVESYCISIGETRKKVYLCVQFLMVIHIKKSLFHKYFDCVSVIWEIRGDWL